jgi:hypothetical protein
VYPKLFEPRHTKTVIPKLCVATHYCVTKKFTVSRKLKILIFKLYEERLLGVSQNFCVWLSAALAIPKEVEGRVYTKYTQKGPKFEINEFLRK